MAYNFKVADPLISWGANDVLRQETKAEVGIKINKNIGITPNQLVAKINPTIDQTERVNNPLINPKLLGCTQSPITANSLLIGSTDKAARLSY